MKYGTHNSMTYLKPRRLWMHLFQPFTRCQRVDLKRQTELGSRYFDIRVRYRNGELVFAHGLIEYKGDPFKLLRELRDLRINPVIRIGYEGELDEDSEANDHFEAFVTWCKARFTVESVFIKKPIFERIYSDNSINIHGFFEMYADNSRIPLPIKYAKKNNTAYRLKMQGEGYAMFDFIDIL